MIHYLSTRGGIDPVGFDEAVLSGFAADGGLFVPSELPVFPKSDLTAMAGLSYQALAMRIIRPFVDPAVIPDSDLKQLIETSFETFAADEIMPLKRLGVGNLYIQELFHGATLSFKDIAMGFLVNCMDYLLTRQGRKLSIILATTGDTGPAAAHACVGKSSLECWPLYPQGMISEQQERQMTTLGADNVHPVSVAGCVNGGDDLDVVVARLFGDPAHRAELQLSSVNSINWCRVMVQTVHYFYGYFRVADAVGEEVAVSVPSGAFGNLCAGYLARAMGLPVRTFICATNANGTLHGVFEKGVLAKRELVQTVSSAIDIVVPYNFWRFLYFNCDNDPELVRRLMDQFEEREILSFDSALRENFRRGFVSAAVSDDATLAVMREIFADDGYLLDPHGAVAVAGAKACAEALEPGQKVICMATAHPAKFPEAVHRAIGPEGAAEATHPAIESVKHHFQHLRTCRLEDLEEALCTAIRQRLMMPEKNAGVVKS